MFPLLVSKKSAKPQDTKQAVCAILLVVFEIFKIVAENNKGMLVPNIINPIFLPLAIWLAVIASAINTPIHKYPEINTNGCAALQWAFVFSIGKYTQFYK
jgi:hypothetical protein